MVFHFKQFSVKHSDSVLKVGTDAVLLGAWTHANDAKNILDIGTGCGIIALMLAQKSSAKIVGIEPDPNSFNEASYNFQNSPWADRLKALPMDLATFLDLELPKFDLIISNPPYYASKAYSYTQKTDVPDSSRIQAASQQSLSFTTLLAGVLQLMDEKGKFEVILPTASRDDFIRLAEENGLYLVKVLNVRSKHGSRFVRSLMEFSLNKTQVERDELVIYDSSGIRSEAYSALTTDYYL